MVKIFINFIYLITNFAITILIAAFIIFVSFRIWDYDKTRKRYAYLFYAFLILSFPLFLFANQNVITFGKMNAFGYSFYHPVIHRYITFSPFFINIFKWFLIGCFIKIIVNNKDLRQKEFIRYFIPFLNIWLIGKELLNGVKTSRGKFTILPLILGMTFFSFGVFIIPLASMLGLDVYTWYINLLYGPLTGGLEKYEIGYSYMADISIHMNITIPFLSAILILPWVISKRKSNIHEANNY